MILLSQACSDDEPLEKVETATTTKEEPLPVREWYPRQKYTAPYPQGSQPQMMPPQDYSKAQPAQQQAWGGGYQVYQAPPVIIVQPQSQWYGYGGAGAVGQAPAQQQMAAPQQFASPYYYQAPQRPWGSVPESPQGKQQSRTAPATGYQEDNIWSGGWQAPGGAVYPGWGAPYGVYPGIVAPPGYVW